MRDAYIVGACRTAIAKENGALATVPPETLGAIVIKEAVKRSGLQKLELIDEVIMGQCLGFIGNLARYSALAAGLPMEIPAFTIDRQCGSGSTAVHLAATHIMAGVGDIYVAGGAESMTRIPYIAEKPLGFSRSAPRWVAPKPLAPPEIGDPPMGITAENVAEKWGVSREEQDEMGYLSQIKAEKAIKEGVFKEQIVPVIIPQKKGDPIVFDTDEHPRFGTTMEALAKLKPAFKKDGTVTAGTSSGINDGAGALVLADKDKALELGMTPMARIVSFAAAGVDRITWVSVGTGTKSTGQGWNDHRPDQTIEMNEALPLRPSPAAANWESTGATTTGLTPMAAPLRWDTDRCNPGNAGG